MKLFFWALGIVLSVPLLACNSCGCYAGLVNGGQIQYAGKWSIYSGNNHISFRTVHPGDAIIPQARTSYEYFNTGYLGSVYRLNNALFVEAVLPYVVNHYDQDGLQSFTGLGNVQLGLSKTILDFSDQADQRWQLFGKFQVALPTGKRFQNAPNPVLNPGRESVTISPALLLNRMGLKDMYLLSMQYNYEWAYANTKFGNGFRAGIMYGRDLFGINMLNEKVLVMAAASADYQYTAPNQVNGRLVNDNNGEFLITNASIMLKHQRFNLQVKSGIPIYQNISNNNSKILFNLDIGLQITLQS